MNSPQTVTIEGFLPAPAANGSHGHWAGKYKTHRSEKETTWGACKHAGWERISGRARLTVTLVFPNHRGRDKDNLYARCKGVIDGAKSFMVDDSPEWAEVIVRAEVVRGTRATKLTLEELEHTRV